MLKYSDLLFPLLWKRLIRTKFKTFSTEIKYNFFFIHNCSKKESWWLMPKGNNNIMVPTWSNNYLKCAKILCHRWKYEPKPKEGFFFSFTFDPLTSMILITQRQARPCMSKTKLITPNNSHLLTIIINIGGKHDYRVCRYFLMPLQSNDLNWFSRGTWVIASKSDQFYFTFKILERTKKIK